MPLGTVVVPGDSDLELCRAHIERLQQVRGGGLPCAVPSYSEFCSHPVLAFASLSRTLKVLEPSPRHARNCPQSGAFWTVSGPKGPAPGIPGPHAPLPWGCWVGAAEYLGLDRASRVLSQLTVSPTATTASRFYRIDRAQVSTRSPAPSSAGSRTPSVTFLISLALHRWAHPICILCSALILS